MRKSSNMGGGEFEFAPNKLDEKLEKRRIYQDNCFRAVNKIIDSYSKDYIDMSLGTRENFKEEIVKRLVKQIRGLE